MLYLWIARHGLTQHNVDGIIQVSLNSRYESIDASFTVEIVHIRVTTIRTSTRKGDGRRNFWQSTSSNRITDSTTS